MKQTSTSRQLGRVAALTLLVTFSGGLLTGCGGGSTGTPGAAPTVASVPTADGKGAAEPPTAAVSVDDSRPLDRPDTTAAEQDRMYLAYWNCLTSHGIPKIPRANNPKPMDDGRAAYAPARKACAAKEPEDYKDRLKRHDPEKYLDNMRKQIKCIRAKGFKIATGPANDPEIDFLVNSQVPRGLDAASECERQFFGAG